MHTPTYITIALSLVTLLGSCQLAGSSSDDLIDRPVIDLGKLNTCSELTDAFEREQNWVQYCTSDAQCGQELRGTSCGCTRNRVGRLTADTGFYFDLIERANDKQCDLGLASTCDCPAADGFACVENRCSWNYVLNTD